MADLSVIPAKAGIPLFSDVAEGSGIPAFAGMTGEGDLAASKVSYRPLLGDDPHFVARWRAAIKDAPATEQAIQTEIMELCFSIERTVRECCLSVVDRNAFWVQRYEHMKMHSHAH